MFQHGRTLVRAHIELAIRLEEQRAGQAARAERQAPVCCEKDLIRTDISSTAHRAIERLGVRLPFAPRQVEGPDPGVAVPPATADRHDALAPGQAEKRVWPGVVGELAAHLLRDAPGLSIRHNEQPPGFGRRSLARLLHHLPGLNDPDAAQSVHSDLIRITHAALPKP